MTVEKDPNAELDYHVDWSAWLGSDTLDTSTWIVPAGITKLSDSKTATVATIWLQGGTLGAIYRVVNRIVTTSGRKDDRSIFVHMKEK